MNVTEAVATRRSTRAFIDRPVDPKMLQAILQKAARAPSGGNLQPWHTIVLTGPTLERFKANMQPSVAQGLASEAPEYSVYPSELGMPYEERRRKVGEDMYGLLGIERADRVARRAWFTRNFAFFDALVGLFVHTPSYMGPPQWSDLGMWMQTVMLLLREAELDSCAQECWSMFPNTLRRLLPIPNDHILFAGLAIGHADPAVAVNQLVSERASLKDNLTWLEEE